MDKLMLYVRESYYELTEKVTWPTWLQLLSTTRLVIIASIIFVFVVYVFDAISRFIIGLLYGLV